MAGRGLHNERTALAWTRTALALLGAVLLASRLTVDRLGALAVAFTVVALPLAAVVLAGASRRYRAARSRAPDGPVLPDGRLPAGVALLVVVLAIVELGYEFAG